MVTWLKKESKTVYAASHLTLKTDIIGLPDGTNTDYTYVENRLSVVIIPIKIIENSHKYVMVRQYRYPAGSYDLEFPSGKAEVGESGLDAARRELRQETGYTASQLKLIYGMWHNPAGNSGQTNIYMAMVADKYDVEHEYMEKMSELVVEEVEPDLLHKKILANDITDSTTIAALGVYLLNSSDAKQYLENK